MIRTPVWDFESRASGQTQRSWASPPGISYFWGKAGIEWQQSSQERSKVTHGGPLDICRIFGLDGRESYREPRLELLCCPHRLS